MAAGMASCEKEKLAPGSSSTGNTEITPVRSDEDPVAVRGHVKTTSGLAIQGATVAFTPSGQSIPAYSTTTDVNGYYYFGSVALGSYQLQVSASNHITKTVSLNIQVAMERTDTLVHEP